MRMRLHLLVLLLPILQSTITYTDAVVRGGKELKTTGHGKSQVLHLAAFLPYSNRATISNKFELALVMALDAINADRVILPNVEQRIHSSDSACSKDTAQMALLQQM